MSLKKVVFFIPLCFTTLYAQEENQIPANDLRFEVKHSANVFITPDLIVWQASVDDLDFVIKNRNGTSPIGTGYKLNHDKWDLYLDHTYFHPRSSKEKKGSLLRALFPWRQAPFISHGGFVTEAKAIWKINFNIADLELGRSFLVGKFPSLRPNIGLKGGIIDQKFEIDYIGGTAVPSSTKDDIDMKNDLWGIGPRMGLKTLWGLGKRLGVFSDGAFSLLSSNFKINQKEKYKLPKSVGMNFQEHLNMIVNWADLALGIQWNHLFANDKHHLGMKLGWEFNLLFDHNLFMKVLSVTTPGIFPTTQGELSLQGAALGLRFDF